MGVLIATFAVLAFSASSNSAIQSDDVFSDTKSSFEFIGGAGIDDAFDISAFSNKSDASADTISSLEFIEDPEVEDSLESSSEFSLEANRKQPDLVVRGLNTLIDNNKFQFYRRIFCAGGRNKRAWLSGASAYSYHR